jgi:riboflavin kinase/FMN adenylyltransferase
MKIYKLNPKRTYPEIASGIITIGSFDGLHRGHQKIIERAQKLAQDAKSPWGVVTFQPIPQIVIYQDFHFLLTTDEEKVKLLGEYSPHFLGIIRFTPNIKNLSAQDFLLSYIINPLSPSTIVVGPDHYFGKDRSGNIKLLQELGQQRNFRVEIVSHYRYHNLSVSSTRIRELIILGNIRRANELLGRPYTIMGEVVKGQGLGRKLGFPTLNLKIKSEYKLVPPDGVYLVRAKLGARNYYGLINIGFAPTVAELFNLPKKRKLELHLFDFGEEQIEGTRKKISVEILDRIREERKFSTLAELQAQIKKDLRIARELTGRYE